MNESGPSGSKTEQLDATDRRILGLLQREGRASYSAIAEQVHLSTPAVIKRVRRLEQVGIIRGYGAYVEPAKLGLPISVFVRLTCGRASEKRLIAQLPSFPEISECHLMAGDVSFVMRANVSSIEHLHDLLTRLGRFGETDSATVLESPRQRDEHTLGGEY